MTENGDDFSTVDDPTLEQAEEEGLVDDGADVLDASAAEGPSSTNSTVEAVGVVEEVDPLAKAIADAEAKLSREVKSLEEMLSHEKVTLSRIKDKITEGGKTGFFIVQAQVNDFNKRKDLEEKRMVAAKKREFVEKMLPVVDAFRSARTMTPSTTDREESMHSSFASLLSNILAVFEKYGYKEFDAEVGSKLDAGMHRVREVREAAEGEEAGIIVEALTKGMADADGQIVRPAEVIATQALSEPEPVEDAAAEKDIAEGEELEEDQVDVEDEELDGHEDLEDGGASSP